MPVVRWILDDSANGFTYTFEVNPNDGGLPQYLKNIQYQNTTAPGGKVLIFEGQDQAPTIEWSGVILTEDQHLAFVEAFQHRHQMTLTDDLGNVLTIYITSYEPHRQRSFTYPWKRTYNMKATILDWP